MSSSAVLNPSQFRLLLAGPRVARLLPFFTARGYVADACAKGSEAYELLLQAPRHLLLVEIELDDMLCGDLLQRARAKDLAGAVLLLEDPAKSGLIVSTLVRGVDGYVAVPPDEGYLFRVVERQLLAQWALAQGEASAHEAEQRARAERQLQQERAKITELVREIGVLRTENHALKELAARPAVTPLPPASVPDPFPDSAPTRPGNPAFSSAGQPAGARANTADDDDADLFLDPDDENDITDVSTDLGKGIGKDAGKKDRTQDDDILGLDD